MPGQPVRDLLWTKWHWNRFFSEYFGLPLSVSFHQCCTLIFTYTLFLPEKRMCAASKRFKIELHLKIKLQTFSLGYKQMLVLITKQSAHTHHMGRLNVKVGGTWNNYWGFKGFNITNFKFCQCLRQIFNVAMKTEACTNRRSICTSCTFT
jgi:hypothetical protein